MNEKDETLPTDAECSMSVDECPVSPAGVISGLLDGDLAPLEAGQWIRRLIAHNVAKDRAQRQAGQEPAYITPVRTVADLANNLLTMDQTLPIYGAQYIDHPTRGRCAIAVHPTLSRERVKDERWIGAGDELNAAVVWTRAAAPPPAVPEGYRLVPIEPTRAMVTAAKPWLAHYQHMRDGDKVSARAEAYRAMLAAAPDPSP